MEKQAVDQSLAGRSSRLVVIEALDSVGTAAARERGRLQVDSRVLKFLTCRELDDCPW